MRKLLNYSIETDHLIWLQFKDGQHLRVAPSQVGDHLTGADLAMVKRAINLRRDFIRHNLPKTLVLAAAVGLSAFAIVDSHTISQYLSGAPHVQTAPSPAVNPAAIIASPSPSPTPIPTSAPASVAEPTPSPRAAFVSPPPAAVPAVSNALVPDLQKAPAPAVGPLTQVIDMLSNKVLR